MANQAWVNAYPNYKTSNLDFSYSDHRPVIVNTNVMDQNMRTPRFHYFPFNHNWLIEEDYKSTIKDIWGTNLTNGSLPRKLHHVSKNIQGWASSSVGSLSRQINKIRIQIESIGELEDNLESDCNRGFLENQLEKLLMKEEVYWK